MQLSHVLVSCAPAMAKPGLRMASGSPKSSPTLSMFPYSSIHKSSVQNLSHILALPFLLLSCPNIRLKPTSVKGLMNLAIAFPPKLFLYAKILKIKVARMRAADKKEGFKEKQGIGQRRKQATSTRQDATRTAGNDKNQSPGKRPTQPTQNTDCAPPRKFFRITTQKIQYYVLHSTNIIHTFVRTSGNAGRQHTPKNN